MASHASSNSEYIDLPSGLRERCERVYGWSRSMSSRMVKDYKDFMRLKKLQEDWHATILSPSLFIDQVWHQHILDVEHYVKACQDYTGGRLIGHNPDGGVPAQANARERCIQNTRLCYKTLFATDCPWVFSEVQGNTSSDDDDDDEEEEQRIAQPTARKKRKLLSELGSTTQWATAVDERITLRVRDRTGEETFFKVKKRTKMDIVFKAFAQRKGVDPDHLRFMLDGEKIQPYETILTLELDDQDQIDVILEQTGC